MPITLSCLSVTAAICVMEIDDVLVASMVLRCDDCIKYHLGKSFDLGVTTEQVYEVFAVANIVGGTIVIPHTRRAAEYWEELVKASEGSGKNQ